MMPGPSRRRSGRNASASPLRSRSTPAGTTNWSASRRQVSASTTLASPRASGRRWNAPIERAALPILCATSTLAQGVNLPTKTVIVSGTMFNQTDELTVRDFRNTAGRAGRPFRETEGHVILVAKTAAQARRLRERYVESPGLEPIYSALTSLYVALVRARLGTFPNFTRQAVRPSRAHRPDRGRRGPLGRGTRSPALLTALAEEVVQTDDEEVLRDAVAAALGDTFGGFQIRAEDLPYRATGPVRGPSGSCDCSARPRPTPRSGESW